MFEKVEFGRATQALRYFEEIAKIPRGSGNVSKIAEFLCKFAKEHGLSYSMDDACNVLICKPASVGYEGHEPVILQGHIDMVAVKKPNAKIDMEKEGLTLFRDGDFLGAVDTSLGGDDGIAVAYMLAILADGSLKHPPLECLFTSDEEIGLLGATAFDCSKLKGRRLINLDSEEEGIFTLGCAGGERVDLCVKCKFEENKTVGTKITLSGLIGGHSGAEIHKRGANAIICLAKALKLIHGVMISDFFGGLADNAIPSECSATMVGEVSQETVRKMKDLLISEYGDREPNLKITSETCGIEKALTREDSEKLLNLLSDVPNGVIKMHPTIEGLVQTSLNFGIAKFSEDGFTVSASVRSSVNEEKEDVTKKLIDIGNVYGAQSFVYGSYPAWEYHENSALCEVMSKTFEKLYNKKPLLFVIHAGLECGVFAGKIPGFDAVSIGPDMLRIHTADERLSLSSAARVYDFLLELLKEL